MQRTHAQIPDSLPETFGFRTGQKGVHNSRTLMFEDLELLLSELPADALNDDYRRAIREENVLAKNTDSTRHYVGQRLSQLYGLDADIPLFRVFRAFWERDEQGRRMLALLLALARDPILRMTAPSILEMERGEPFDKARLQTVIAKEAGDRFNETSVKKISRMTASSWTQSGHLEGHRKKTRAQPAISAPSTAYALVLGFLCGVRGELLFDTFWAQVLDAPEHELHDQAQAASRRGLLTYRNAGGIIEVDASPVLTPSEMEQLHEQN
jgi:hypothetical protein